MRWREEDIEKAILDELASMQVPDQQIAEWFRRMVQESFEDVKTSERQRQGLLTKRRSELIGMKDRLLNAYLSGAIDENTFKTKQTVLKQELAEVEESLATTRSSKPDSAARALHIFNLSQNILDI